MDDRLFAFVLDRFEITQLSNLKFHGCIQMHRRGYEPLKPRSRIISALILKHTEVFVNGDSLFHGQFFLRVAVYQQNVIAVLHCSR